MKRTWALLSALAFPVGLGLALTAGAAGCNTSSAGSALKQPKAANKLSYPVQVAPLEVRQVQYSVIAPGSLEAFQQVQITARVAGAVDNVKFVEGQTVKKGDPLVVIEVDRYQVAVDQAKAALDKAAASEKLAEAEVSRRQGAVAQNPGLVTGEEIATFQTQVETSKADMESARQALRVAQINLRDAYVRAPFDGAIQTRTVQQGQYLQPGAILGTLIQRDPLILRFPVTEQDAPRIKLGMKAHMTLRESPRTYDADIILVSEAADPTTRLVTVAATVDDTEHKYWLRPGAFCDVSVPIGDAKQAIVVPALAVQPTEKGNVVYTVDASNTAHLRQIQLGMYTPDGGVEVTQGLTAGDLLVVRGFEPLTEGARVQITEKTTLAAAVSAAASGDVPPTAGSGHGGGGGGGAGSAHAGGASSAASAASSGHHGGASP
jgi:membrane fusion protein, multidrug efflux system